MRHSIVRLLCLLAIGGLYPCTFAGDGSLPPKLSPDTFEAIKARVNVTPKDVVWKQVRWHDGFFEGLAVAQAEDKPLFLWIYEGGPTGNC